jgi:DNA polymerase-3 subunit delta
VLHGDEALLQQEAADAIRAAARAQGYTERSSFTVAGATSTGAPCWRPAAA